MSPFWILLVPRMVEVVVTTGAVRRAKLQSNRHHQQTNTQYFYRSDPLSVAHRTVSQHWRKFISQAQEQDFWDIEPLVVCGVNRLLCLGQKATLWGQLLLRQWLQHTTACVGHCHTCCTQIYFANVTWCVTALCGLSGCKNRPPPSHGRMS